MADEGGPDFRSGAGAPSEHPKTSPSSSDFTHGSRGTGVSVALVVGLVLAVLATVVAIQNTREVTVDFLAWQVGAPMVAVILTAGIAGVVLDEVLGLFWRRRRRRTLADGLELRRLRRG